MSSAPTPPSAQPPKPKPNPTPARQPIITKYDCGGCGAENTLRPGDKVECRVCSYPVLFKQRTRRIVEFQAR